jgi:hypothetical protein
MYDATRLLWQSVEMGHPVVYVSFNYRLNVRLSLVSVLCPRQRLEQPMLTGERNFMPGVWLLARARGTCEWPHKRRSARSKAGPPMDPGIILPSQPALACFVLT